jgi:hypothetical protein
MANTKPTGVAYADPALESWQVGSSLAPVTQVEAGNITQLYATASVASGGVRGYYGRVNFTGATGGETLRAFTTVAAAQGSGQTTNGAHISMSVNSGGSISGAGNALRATLGVAAGVTPGGTLASIQVDSDFPSTVTLPGSAAFLRFTNSNTGSIVNLMNVPAGIVTATAGAAAKSIKIVASDGTPYWILLATAAS